MIVNDRQCEENRSEMNYCDASSLLEVPNRWPISFRKAKRWREKNRLRRKMKSNEEERLKREGFPRLETGGLNSFPVAACVSDPSFSLLFFPLLNPNMGRTSLLEKYSEFIQHE